LANKRGADFVVLDRPLVDPLDSHRYNEQQLLGLTNQVASITSQVRARTSLPIWWAEVYFGGSDNWDLQAVGLASLLYHQLVVGAEASFRWAPQAQPTAQFGGNDQNLFSSTLVAGGGQPFPNYWVYRTFHEEFGPGTELFKATSSSPDVEVLASATRTLVINKRPTETHVLLNGSLVTVRPYSILLV
jgi:hypothetical protein